MSTQGILVGAGWVRARTIMLHGAFGGTAQVEAGFLISGVALFNDACPHPYVHEDLYMKGACFGRLSCLGNPCMRICVSTQMTQICVYIYTHTWNPSEGYPVLADVHVSMAQATR